VSTHTCALITHGVSAPLDSSGHIRRGAGAPGMRLAATQAMKLAILLVLGSACASSGDDSYPILTEGEGGFPVGGVTTESGTVQGRICMIVDPRFLDACTATGAGGLTVTLGETSTVTAASGTFTLARPKTMPANATLMVSGSTIVPSLVPATAPALIPVVNTALFTEMLTANDVMLATGTGSVIAGLTTAGGAPVTGAAATSTPTGAFGPFFDGTTATGFTLTGTGLRGITWFPGVPVGIASLSFMSGGTESTVSGIQVVDGGITFVDSVLP
jgi:hypothetical protein